MSNYIQTTIFTPKDSLPTTDPNKTIFGAAYDVEFGNISTAIASKVDTASNATLLSLALTGTNVPVAGINSPTASGVGLTAGSAVRLQISSAGNVTINAPSSGTALAINTFANSNNFTISDGTETFYITNDASHNFGLGTQAAHTLNLITNASVRMAINSAGNVTVNAPASGTALTVTGASGANLYSGHFIAGSTTGQSFGLLVDGGTNSSDTALLVRSQTGGTLFLSVNGAGQTIVLDAAGNQQPVGTRNVPVVIQNSNYTFVAADAGRSYNTTVSSAVTYTVPNGVFSPGDVITIANMGNTAGTSLTISPGAGLALYWQPSGSGSNALQTARTLAGTGICTLWFANSGQCVISGSGLA